ncbi:MAG: pilus assembly protein PilM, partial [Parcubacteria group bacterium]|nr:pilus assembly protein PilM [Parcubacteria group bacterium]
THPSRKISGIYLSGGGANLNKFDSILSQKLKIKVRKCDPTYGIQYKDPLFQKQGPKYATAIGLAIRGIIYPYV